MHPSHILPHLQGVGKFLGGCLTFITILELSTKHSLCPSIMGNKLPYFMSVWSHAMI
jgi:hypothetical protein